MVPAALSVDATRELPPLTPEPRRARQLPPTDSTTGVLLLTATCGFLAFLDVTIVNIAFPDIRRSFPSTDLATLSWVLNAYNVLLAALLVPAGRWADALGRRRMLLTGLAVFGVASLVCGVAPGVGVLIAGRALQAVGAALLVPSSVAILLHAVAPRRRVTAVGLWGAAGAVAAAVGPPLGGLLVQELGWRAVFLVPVPLTALLIWLCRRNLVESRDPEAGRPAAGVVGPLAVAFGLVALGLVQGESWGWTSVRTLACFAGGVVAAVVAAVWARSGSARRDLGGIGRRPVAIANLGTLIFSAAFYGLLLTYVLFLTGVWHYSVLHAGLAMAPGALAAAAAAGPAGRAAEKHGHRIVTVVGCLVYVAGCLMFATRTTTSPAYLTDWLPCFLLTGAGTGIVLPNLLGAALAPLPLDRLATGSSVNSAARQVGGVLGVAVVIAVMDARGGASVLTRAHHIWSFAAVVGGVVALLGLFLRPATAPGEAVLVHPSRPGSRGYPLRYLCAAAPRILRRHRLSADSVGRRYTTSFRLSGEEFGRWQDLFDVRPGQRAPLAYYTTSGALGLMRLLADTGINFRYLLHLQTEMRRPADADAVEPDRTYSFELRLSAIVRLSGSKVGLVIDTVVRTESGRLVQQGRETFLIRRVGKALAKGLPTVPPPLELDLATVAGYFPRLSADDAATRTTVGIDHDLGRRFGEISGDRNVVHTTHVAARIFGYRKPFIQGLCTASTVAAALTDAGRPPVIWSRLTFCSPVWVGQRIQVLADDGTVEVRSQSGRVVAFGSYARAAAGREPVGRHAEVPVPRVREPQPA